MTVLCPHCKGRLIAELPMRDPYWLCLCCGRRYPSDNRLQPVFGRPPALREPG